MNNLLKLVKNPASIYALIWCLYYLQGTFYAVGGMVSKILLLFFIILSILFYVKLHYEYKLPQCLRVLDVLFFIFIFYELVLIIRGVDLFWKIAWYSPQNSLKETLLSIPPIFSFYYFSKKGYLSERWFKDFFWIFLVVSIFQYIMIQRSMLELRANAEDVTNNAGYYWLALFPFIYFFRKTPILQYGILLVLVYFIVAGMKRGAIVIGAFEFVYFLRNQMRGAKVTMKIWMILLSLVAIIAIVYLVNYFMATSDYFNYRIDATLEGNASGREDMYPEIWASFWSGNILTFLFGYGAGGTLANLGYGAHQDWLETLYNFGIIGFGLLFSYVVTILHQRKNSSSDEIKYLFGLVLIIYLGKTLFSMSIHDSTLMITSLLGFCIGESTNHNSNYHYLEG